MKHIKQFKKLARLQFFRLAVLLNYRFGKHISPDRITWVGFAAHIPIAWLIAFGYLAPAAVLLAFFGLFDTLDGALARVQKVAGPRGMFLDASTDRLKEVLLYTGLALYFVSNDADWPAFMATLACGLALSVSYIKAKGEAALSAKDKTIPHEILNRIFEDGYGSFEIRMTLLVIGLLIGLPEWAIVLIIVLSLQTLFVRFRRVMAALK